MAHLASTPPTPRAFRPFNLLIGSNEPQISAISKIVAQPAGSPPFIVFGPPGTGKTITIVEAIRQILVTNPRGRILACAPSNSAADIIAVRLAEALKPHELYRFYAPSRQADQSPDALSDYVKKLPGGQYTTPPLNNLLSFRVVVSTCVSASFASGVGVPRGHFTHIFVDEAGQATEPETMICIKTLADSQTNIVLSGDPKQLGPIIRSPIARSLGLELSYLERIMPGEGYSLSNNRGQNVVKLTKNFRSHANILRFPNELFYDGDLEACGSPSVINTYLGSSYLPSKSFPLVFHAVIGKDDREASSPSFFNPEEVLQVKDYITRLKDDRKYRISDKDIGVIAPYHAQCQKIRKHLSTIAENVKVGSVEEFQGQERKVIIISTVRSSEEFVEYDIRHTLGFVASPRRFNVAVTRAQALLIVVGNPRVLGLDPLWRSFLNYIHLNGGWTGADIPWDPEDAVHENGGYDTAAREGAAFDMNEFVQRIESMTMAGVDDVSDPNAVDRPWVNNE